MQYETFINAFKIFFEFVIISLGNPEYLLRPMY